MFIKIKVHLKMIYDKVSSLYRKKKESIDALNEENTFSPLPGYIERVDCEKRIVLYLTLKEVKQIPTSMVINSLWSQRSAYHT